MEEEIFDRLLNSMNQLGGDSKKIMITNVALALTGMGIQNKKSPKEVVDLFYDTLKELEKQRKK